MLKLTGLAFLAGAAACGGGECLALPCPLPLALTITLQSAATRTGVKDATIAVTGPTQTTMSCDTVCMIPGTAGDYHLSISAPGFTTVNQDVTVTGDNPSCGCSSTHPVSLTIAL